MMLLAEHLWTDDGWQRDVRIDGAPGGELHARFVLPGMPNLHSHAFQRAMAGLAERRGPGEDSFWTWRETMYAFASRIGPEELQAIAAQLYVEMLKAGYTHVCEFHYLHNAPDGTRYANPAAMSLAIVEAAREAGIGLTLLPVLYMRSEEHTSELQSPVHLVCRLLLEKKKKNTQNVLLNIYTTLI